jgi:hypothetical protein
MGTRISAAVVFAVRSKKKDQSLGDGTLAGIASRAVRLYHHKHHKCFICKFHKELVAGLELARQKLALSGIEPCVNEFIGIRPKEMQVASELANHDKTTKQVLEQALLEHVARPKECTECPYYAEMCEKALVANSRRKN